ncbi:MAG: EAL domain-containing protein [Sneathiellaceae bacterium]
MIAWIAVALAGIALLLGGAALALALTRMVVLRRQVRLAMASAIEAAERADEAAAAVERLSPDGGSDLAAELEDVKHLLGQLAQRIQEGAVRPGAPRGEGRAAAQSMTVAVQEAVEGNRVDIVLQPVVTLPQRNTRFMTASCRLRDANGQALPADQAMAMVAHLGLGQELDNQLLFRCVQMVRRMKRRPRKVGLFCGLSAASLADADFFAQFAEYLEGDTELPDFLVFELPAAVLEQADEAMLQRLYHLTELGFHLGVARLADPRMDAAELARAGISFARIDVDRLLPPGATGDADAGGPTVAGSRADQDWLDAYIALRRENILPIAVGVEAEGQVPALLDLEISLAEGPLFGAAQVAGLEP